LTELNEAIASAQLLLEEPDVETGVRVGDIYALIIEFVHALASIV
jgi:hypothetical protein